MPCNPDMCPASVDSTACGMPMDDGGTWCEREYQIGAARDQVRHNLAKLRELGVLPADVERSVIISIGADL